MAQSLTQIYVHIVFSTKHRQPVLADDIVREQTYRYLAGYCNKLGNQTLLIGRVEDHVHILCRLNKSITMAN